MELLVNDLSIAGQFPDVPTFMEAISRVMKMRIIARQFGRELHCHRNIAHAKVTRNKTMPQAIQAFSLDERRAVMQWITQHGPFWEDDRSHRADDYLEYNLEIVTDTAIGEAAYCCLHGTDRHIVSLTPSSWEFSPVSVDWVLDSEDRRHIDVVNHWQEDELEVALRNAPAPVTSWEQLIAVCLTRCPHLTFSADSFDPLHGHPFVAGAAERIRILLETLDRFKCCFDAHGQRTSEGQWLYQNHFTGEKSWFSDSSDSEKHTFEKELTFRHPAVKDKRLFCTWHGKVKTPQIRLHFSWPVRADVPLYIVYVGPKITKR